MVFLFSRAMKFVFRVMHLRSKSVLYALLIACCLQSPYDLFAQLNSISIEPVFFHATSIGSTDVIPEGAVTYHIYANFDNQTDFLSSVFGNEACALQISSTEPFFQSSLGGHTADFINPVLFSGFPELQFDSFVTLGKTNSNDVGGEILTLEDPANPWIAPFENGNALVIDSFVGGLWFVFNDGSSTNAVAGNDLRVLIAQVTTTGTVTGQAQGQVFLTGDPSNVTISDCLNFELMDNLGCVDDTACNYDATATVDDGSCLFIGDPCDDGDPDTFNEVINEDCECVGESTEGLIFGCTDEEACNFNEEATNDDGSCIYTLDVTALISPASCHNALDGAIELTITNAQGEIEIVWNNGETTLSLSNLAAGEYAYVVVDDSGCEASGEVVVAEPEPISVSETIVHPSCGNSTDGSIQLESEEDLIYSWLGDVSDASATFITNLQGGVYTVIVEDPDGCEAQIEFTLTPVEESCLIIPTGFTPNNDGYNDVWEIIGWEEYPRIAVSVFNRWGQELYNSTGYEEPWDGIHNGLQLPMASYYYVITLAPGETPLTGHVTIKY